MKQGDQNVPKPGIASRALGTINRFLRPAGVEMRRRGGALPAPAANHPLPEPWGTAPSPSPASIAAALDRFRNEFPISPGCTLSSAQIDARLSSFYWHYPFVFGDRAIEADWEPGKGLRGRHFQRFVHFMPALLEQVGGSLNGMGVLDLGCNCGFWSIQARLLGAGRVLGIEGSAENVEQAQFILDLIGLDGIEYRAGDATTIRAETVGRFDVTFFLGLLYHVADPMAVLGALADVTRRVAVVDTSVIPDPAAFLNVQPDRVHRQNFRNPMAFFPSLGAVPVMLTSAGFREVLEVPRVADELPIDYRRGTRVTFLALK